ncbi:hypothetical protein ABZ484_08325 [Streptomyces sp. NPDC006393]|uniref:hypothetical protein n=1 Tax=Streptomyces sp. NPDC006393 TaxID=3156763 RepID=UPI0033E2595B
MPGSDFPRPSSAAHETVVGGGGGSAVSGVSPGVEAAGRGGEPRAAGQGAAWHRPGVPEDAVSGSGLTPPRTGGVGGDARAADARSRFQAFGPPARRDTAPTTPPPPAASARFPDAPPRIGRPAGPRSGGWRESAAGEAGARAGLTGPPRGSEPTPDGFPGAPRTPSAAGPSAAGPSAAGPFAAGDGEDRARPGAVPASGRTAPDPDVPGAVPSPPGHRPSPAAPRTAVPAETPSETTARLRPLSARRPGAAAGPPPAPSGGDLRRDSAVPGTDAFVTGGPPAGSPDRGLTPAPGVAVPAAPAAAVRSAAVPPGPRVAPDPALSWSAFAGPAAVPGAARAQVRLGEPEGYDERGRGHALGGRVRARTAVAAACLVLGLGLIGGAVTGSWLTGDSGEGGAAGAFATAGGLWHSIPVDQLFPPTVEGRGAGPGGADRTWTRVAVAPDSGCANAFDPLLRKALAPAGCARLLRATYTDATQTYVTTVGLLFTKADAPAMKSLAARFTNEGLARRADLMPRPYAAKDTVAAAFGDKQRASWTVSVLTEAPVVVYAVSGWADGRTVDSPQPAADAMRSGATTAAAQAGLGNEAQGLADRIERALRKNVDSATDTEKPS